ncbi:sigma factor-like helix-turn-helix DNA-binding protein [Mycolicibacter sp. MYC123]|uniref:Sigma factor-like helix-turn-helix DNA-binding protein n=1 Tax=[Mycobacterium] zoologicum TaxID=2872311 RepID=A0ABU5YGZ9_9MYCO|nr:MULTISPECIES: sigma factor-like helix-turn-helix DNA-binding protein [unclassified Mycolicibacter]MEB3049322.1 sigma factor-like helix-turn-helix DNA-binding protein [Mycolicibacter sp. MYC123]MEB3062623.1 sigma factor-like helix-turn-helix DNA-binding protein [Mycolicibacter sp. MYC101]
MDFDDAGNRWMIDRGQAAAAMRHDSARILVNDALAQLSPDNQVLLRRAYHHGWTTGQIAAEQGIAEASVKAQLHYALRTFQQTLRDMGLAP